MSRTLQLNLSVSAMGKVFSTIRQFFFTKRLEIVLVGLENSGKTTFCNQLALGEGGSTTPTVGLNVRVLKKGKVTFKVWDIGGQQKYRDEWPRYAQGCDVIVFVVDSFDTSRLPEAKIELHQLLEQKELKSTSILVLANKIDLGAELTEEEMIKELNLDYITENAWMVMPVSAKDGTNVESALEFLMKYSH